MPCNNGPNALHGGTVGYDKRVWTPEPVGPSSLRLTLTDPDGDMGFPGTVHATVVYTFTADHTLRIEYTATTDKPTPVNLTNHSYWNLKDAGASPITGHEMRSPANGYLPVDGTLIPTGEVAPVAGTPFDFRTAKAVGRDLAAVGGQPAGYDHCLVLSSRPARPLAEAVTVYEPTTGRSMAVWTTEPGVQFYTGNFLNGGQVGPGRRALSAAHGHRIGNRGLSGRGQPAELSQHDPPARADVPDRDRIPLYGFGAVRRGEARPG